MFFSGRKTLRSPAIQFVWSAWVLISFSLLQVSRLITTMIWPPLPDRMQPDTVQAFYSVLDYILGLGSCFAVVWLTLCAQRHDLHIMATTDGLSGLMNRRAS